MSASGQFPLTEKTLVVWAQPENLQQRGAGLLSILQGDAFDSIVLGEVRPGVWMAGSEHFHRTETDQENWPAETQREMVCIAVVYRGDRIKLYRNGSLQADYPIDRPRSFTRDCQILIGQRHADQGFFAGQIEEARIYARALSVAEIATLMPAPVADLAQQAGAPLALWTFEDGTARDEAGLFQNYELKNGARIEGGRLMLDGINDYVGKTVDYTSKAPRREYAETLEAQEAQLRDDPLMRRFAQSRQSMHGRRYRPRYHFVNPEGPHLNDPNGLCFWQGRWHMFYQGYPPEDPRPHWGHAVSDDLIHWRDLPYAIYPHPEQMCFSGSTLVEEDRVIAIYHGIKAGTMVAVSDDPLLLNWEKLTGNAVIPLAGPGDPPLPYEIFDPCIWKKGDSYYALTAGKLNTGPGGKLVRAEFLHRSSDLINWEYLHPFLEDDRFGLIGDDGACPNFLPIGDRHILLHFSHLSGANYLLGDYDTERDKFVVTAGGSFNHGPTHPGAVHAPSATSDGRGSVIAIFNMNHNKPTEGWDQMMTLPRRLTLQGEEDLRIEPAGDYQSLRGAHHRIENLTLPANEEIVLDDIQGDAMEILAEFAPPESSVIELNVFRSTQKEEYTRIVFYRNAGYHLQGDQVPQSLISIDTSHSSLASDVVLRGPETAPVLIEKDEPLKLHVFLDRSIVEVFVNGKQCLALRVYPEREDSLGVSVRAQGRDTLLESLDAWEMKSIYDEPREAVAKADDAPMSQSPVVPAPCCSASE